MGNMVKSFKVLTPELQVHAGGKGGMLVKIYQGGYPVPDGFAVRSFGLSEDSAQASFTGEFESVLNVGTDKDIKKAIDAVISEVIL
ncbi:PEP/pyruvate-binding domain-containing protein [Clostridium formicaceticum]|uniref:Phosphoenolpyruvate synthase n=1 Tax=Clostridium formicaceticum TaxID=1497 RepID=A0AAC9RNZ0_9CLOT|nr:hypothetical protein BJL90_00810 [Clostridium formicaceticum]ARE88987.1 phosphoenolpyruvate synthase [Clostridium formicaceticum]